MRHLFLCSVLVGVSLLSACNSNSSSTPSATPSDPVPTFAAGPKTFGYVRMPDGTPLHYYLQLPSGDGKFPTLFTYDMYTAGSSTQVVEDYSRYVAQGYAVIGVNMRGTGCSGGDLLLTDAVTYGKDGAEIVEWIAQQAWSNGHVGMVGGSGGGLTQLATAIFAPPHLDAISPMFSLSDVYRGLAYPGGIFNRLWVDEYTLGFQMALSAVGGSPGIVDADSSCAVLTPDQLVSRITGNNALLATQHPYFDEIWNLAPARRLEHIHIPVFACQTWQDGAVSSDGTQDYFDGRLNPAMTWFVGNNGGHGSCVLPEGMLDNFLERYVKGVRNGFEKSPHLTLQHEAVANGVVVPFRLVGGDLIPSWTSTVDNWPDSMKPVTLHLHRGGAMDASADTDSGSDTYAYPLPSSSNGETFIEVPNELSGWQIYGVPAGAVSYTTPPLADDAEFFGAGSVNLWFASTAADTDVQVTLTEIRPDGNEQFIQRGWLRMSHRKLDPSRSTNLWPYHTHLQEDAEPLTPATPTFVRVGLRPFDHVFRKGSSLRLTIDAPTGITYGTGFDYLTTLAQNTIYHGGQMDSQLVLSMVPGGRAQKPLPECNTVVFEPCRPALGTVPQGQLALP